MAPYPWSRSVKTGVWLRALGNGDQRRPMGRKARERLNVFLLGLPTCHLSGQSGILAVCSYWYKCTKHKLIHLLTAIFRTCTSKTAKITKGDIIQQHIDTQSVWCGQYHLLWFLLFCTFVLYKHASQRIRRCSWKQYSAAVALVRPTLDDEPNPRSSILVTIIDHALPRACSTHCMQTRDAMRYAQRFGKFYGTILQHRPVAICHRKYATRARIIG